MNIVVILDIGCVSIQTKIKVEDDDDDGLLWFWMMKMVFMSSRILLWNFDLVLELYDRTHPEQR